MTSSRFMAKVRGIRHPWQIALLLFILALTFYVDTDQFREWSGQAAPQVPTRGTGTCVNVIDGDTLDIRGEDGGEFRVRLPGIDAMETHNEEKMAEQAARLGRPVREIRMLGEKAREELRDFALNAPVEWETAGDGPVRDDYGRVLAYVSVAGEDAGAFLLSKGLAELRREPHPRREEYRRIARPLLK